MATQNLTIGDLVFQPLPSIHNFKDLTGRQFDQLTVLGYIGRRGTTQKRSYWAVQCTCGTIRIVTQETLSIGRTRSCGCMKRLRISQANRTHGKRYTSEYSIWCDIRKRCNNPRSHAYEDYGGRGIIVCPEWDDFSAFLHDMGERPSPLHEIDRINNNGNYEPSNCRWVTRQEQCNNTRRNHWLTYRGQTHTIAEWARILQMSRDLIRQRLKLGWSVEDAFTAPLFTKRQSLEKSRVPRLPELTTDINHQ